MDILFFFRYVHFSAIDRSLKLCSAKRYREICVSIYVEEIKVCWNSFFSYKKRDTRLTTSGRNRELFWAGILVLGIGLGLDHIAEDLSLGLGLVLNLEISRPRTLWRCVKCTSIAPCQTR